MNFEKRIEAFAALGDTLRKKLADGSLEPVIATACAANPWFTPAHVTYAVQAWGDSLTPSALQALCHGVADTPQPKTVAIIMAGNLPLVGMHDWLCVLLAGHTALVKLSSNDDRLLPYLNQLLCALEPAFAERTRWAQAPLKQFDAVIATGSNNSHRYFDYYFGKYPHIIRHSRTSVAVLCGDESNEELAALCDDIFIHFGLGCRNVSLLLVPEDYRFDNLIAAAQPYAHYRDNHLYCSSLDYHKALLLLNAVPFVDGDFFMLQQEELPAAPVSMVHYLPYSQLSHAAALLQARRDEIQCVVCRPQLPLFAGGDALAARCVAFGEAQRPRLTDFADGVDTMQFLSTL